MGPRHAGEMEPGAPFHLQPPPRQGGAPLQGTPRELEVLLRWGEAPPHGSRQRLPLRPLPRAVPQLHGGPLRVLEVLSVSGPLLP